MAATEQNPGPRRSLKGFDAVKQAGRDLSARYGSNIVTNHLLLKRRKDHSNTQIRVHGFRYLFLSAMVVFLTAVVLDMPVGSFRGQWPGSLRSWAGFFTDLGKSGWILYPTGIFLIIGFGINWRRLHVRNQLILAKWMSAAGYIFVAVGVSGLIATILKRVIGRARPMHYEEHGAFYFQPFSDASYASFPSGHSTTSGAIFAAVAIFFPKLRYPALVLAVWLGFSRVLVGAHYPSDVVAGVAFGAWYAYFSALFFARYDILFTTDENGWPVRRRGYELVRFWKRRRGVFFRSRGANVPHKD